MTAPLWLRLPSQVLHLLVVFWSSAIGGLLGYVKAYKMSGLRSDMRDWAEFLVVYFNIKIMKKGTRSLYKTADGSPVMYLSNHRSFTDFWLDVWLTEGLAAPLSRMMVFTAMPVFMSYCVAIKGVVLFKRQTIADKEGFNKWLDEKIKDSPLPSLLVYPEGHRNFKNPKPLPLRRGMLNYGYSRKLPFQIVMSSGKEQVFNERHIESHRSVTTVTAFSEVIDSKTFESFEAFSSEVQRMWDSLWFEVLESPVDMREVAPLLQPDLRGVDLPMPIRIRLAAVMLVSVVLLFLTAYATWMFWGAVLGVFPLVVRKVIFSLLALWLGASLLVWTRPPTPSTATLHVQAASNGNGSSSKGSSTAPVAAKSSKQS